MIQHGLREDFPGVVIKCFSLYDLKITKLNLQITYVIEMRYSIFEYNFTSQEWSYIIKAFSLY